MFFCDVSFSSVALFHFVETVYISPKLKACTYNLKQINPEIVLSQLMYPLTKSISKKSLDT